MLASRLKVAIILIPIAVVFLAIGGWPFAAFISILLGMAAYEFWRMFQRGGFNLSAWILVPGVIVLALARQQWDFQYSDAILAVLVLAAMAYQTIQCEKHCQSPAIDFSITLAGLLYIGWLGSYLISLRTLPQGLWWVLLVIPAIGIGDTGAYFIGRRFGKHKLAPVVSPHKTIEGYLGGVAFTILGALVLAALWRLRFPEMMLWQALVLGLVLGILTPMGDLGESMLKRQFHLKDTGTLFAGHGGVLDRLDSWLWGAVISYYIITWFF